MKNLLKVLIVSSMAVSALALACVVDVDLRANLTGMGHGRAEWKTQDRGTRMRAELKVDGEHLAANSDFTVTVGSNPSFTVTTNSGGEFESDQRFNDANRPTVNTGDSVTVADATSTVVLSGVLSNHH